MNLNRTAALVCSALCLGALTASPESNRLVTSFELPVMREIIDDLGWTWLNVYSGESPVVTLRRPDGRAYRFSGSMCAPDGKPEDCQAIILEYETQQPNAVSIAHGLNRETFFMRASADTQFSPPNLWLRHTVHVAGGITRENLLANIATFEFEVDEVERGLEVNRPKALANGLRPGLYATSYGNPDGNSFTSSYCLDPRDGDEPAGAIAAEMTAEGAACFGSPSGTGAFSFTCTSQLIEGAFFINQSATSLSWNGSATIDTDGMGGREIVRLHGSANWQGPC